MPTSPSGRVIGLLNVTATIAIMGGIIWIAARNARTRLEHRLCSRVEAAAREVYSHGYVDGLDRTPPTTGPRRLKAVD